MPDSVDPRRAAAAEQGHRDPRPVSPSFPFPFSASSPVAKRQLVAVPARICARTAWLTNSEVGRPDGTNVKNLKILATCLIIPSQSPVWLAPLPDGLGESSVPVIRTASPRSDLLSALHGGASWCAPRFRPTPGIIPPLASSFQILSIHAAGDYIATTSLSTTQAEDGSPSMLTADKNPVHASSIVGEAESNHCCSPPDSLLETGGLPGVTGRSRAGRRSTYEARATAPGCLAEQLGDPRAFGACENRLLRRFRGSDGLRAGGGQFPSAALTGALHVRKSWPSITLGSRADLAQVALISRFSRRAAAASCGCAGNPSTRTIRDSSPGLTPAPLQFKSP